MYSRQRQIYGLLLRLHPAEFRHEFAREMALDFEEALETHGSAWLYLDAAGSLARQWVAAIASAVADPSSGPQPSLLAGNYVMLRDRRFTLMELGRGMVAAVTQLALCLLALNASSSHGLLSGPALSGSRATPGRASPGTAVAAEGKAGARLSALRGAVTASTQTIPAAGSGRASGASAGCSLPAAEETGQPAPELLLFHASSPAPAYEVATVKPLDPEAASSVVRLPPGSYLSPLSIRRYIMHAYGAVYPPQVVGGPSWLNKDAYVIQGKIPEEEQAAFRNMSREQRLDETRMMEQCLLADRFHLRAHFESRVLPVYELAPAKGGLRISPVPAPSESDPGSPRPTPPADGSLLPGTLMSTFDSNGFRVLNGHAIGMVLLARTIVGDIGERPIVDHTGFTGFFDVTGLTWVPLSAGDIASEADASSLEGALKEKLGVRIVPARDPVEVLVIDSIDRPTPN
jgi:uncharacterized protein (TIGR03435 family)